MPKMAHTTENPVSEHLKAMRSELVAMCEDLRQLRNCQVETQTAVLRFGVTPVP